MTGPLISKKQVAWAGPNAKRGTAGATIHHEPAMGVGKVGRLRSHVKSQLWWLERLEDCAVMEKVNYELWVKNGQSVSNCEIGDGTWVTFLVEDAILQFLGT